MVILLILICLNASVTSITQERADGTFERLFVTPYTKAQLIFGKMISYVSISLALSLVTIYSLSIFFSVNLCPVWLVGLIAFAIGLASIALGLLVSALTYSVGESIQVGTLIFFAMLILTGFLFQPENMRPVIEWIYYSLPFTYAILAMREVNLLNFGFSKIYIDLIIICGSALIFLLAAVVVLRRKA